MFCLECGAEMAVRARACPVCGHVYSDSERSLAELHPDHAAHSPSSMGTLAAPASAAQNSPMASYARNAGAVPSQRRSLPERFLLAAALGLAADLLLPWISVNGEDVTPASFSAPVIVVVALLAAATLPVFTVSLRQHPIWSALPMIIGAFCAGIAGAVWLLLAPLVQILAVSFGSDPSNLRLSPQAGLYLFMIGSAVLLVSGQKMLAAMNETQLSEARRDAIQAANTRQATSASARTAPVTASTQPQMVTPVPSVTTAATPAQLPTPTAQIAVPPVPEAPNAPVLPGSDAWHQAPAAPLPVRTPPGSGWGKPRGPQRLR